MPKPGRVRFAFWMDLVKGRPAMSRNCDIFFGTESATRVYAHCLARPARLSRGRTVSYETNLGTNQKY